MSGRVGGVLGTPIEELVCWMASTSEAEVRKCLETLHEDGDVFETIDDRHFSWGY